VRLGARDLLFDLCLLSSSEESTLDVETAHLRLDFAVILLDKRFALHIVGFLLICRFLHGVHILDLSFLRIFVYVGLVYFLLDLVQAEPTPGYVLDTNRWDS